MEEKVMKKICRELSMVCKMLAKAEISEQRKKKLLKKAEVFKELSEIKLRTKTT